MTLVHDRELERLRARLAAACVILAAVSIPLILEVVPPNAFYGFRASGTRAPEVWYPANAFMGWAMLLAAVIAATLQLVLPRTQSRSLLWVVFVTPVGGAIIASFAYLNWLLSGG